MKLSIASDLTFLNTLSFTERRTVADVLTRLGKNTDLESLAQIELLVQKHSREGHLDFELDGNYARSNIKLTRGGENARKKLVPPKRNVGVTSLRKTA